MTGTIRWASRALLALLVTSVVLLGIGQPSSAAPRTAAASAATAKASAELTAQGYVVQFGADGALTVTAQADVRANGAPTAADAAAARALSWSYKFDQVATAQIWDLVLQGSTSGLNAICAAVAPGWIVAVGCAIVANAIISFIDSVGNPNGRCLKLAVTARLGWPPVTVSVSYVTC